MSKTLVSIGKWFLPTTDPKEVKGSLKKEGTAIYLEVDEALKGEAYDFTNYELVLGLTNELGKVTLFNGRVVKVGEYIKIHFSFVFIGEHILREQEDQKIFNTVTFKTHGAQHWFKTCSSKMITNEVKEKTISVFAPPDIELQITDWLLFKATFFVGLSWKEGSNHLINHSTLSLKFKGSHDIFEIIHYADHLRKLLVILGDEVDYFKTFEVTTTSGKNLKVLFDYNIKPAKEDYHSGFYLFNYQDLHKEFPRILEFWFNNEAKLNQITSILANSVQSRNRFDPDFFLETMRATEALHSFLFPDNKIPENTERRVLIDGLIDSLTDSENKDYIKNILSPNKKVSFSDRLYNLIEISEGDFFSNLKNYKSGVVKLLVLNRNHYTHLNEIQKENKLSLKELYYFAKKFNYLILYFLLAETGVSKELINNNFRKLGELCFWHEDKVFESNPELHKYLK